MPKGDGGGGAGGSGSGGASVASGETFGASKARVTHHDYEKKEVDGAVKDVMGKNANIQDVASMVGAPDDASVNISVADVGGKKELNVTVRGDGYHAERIIKKNLAGDLVVKNEWFEVDEDMQGQGIGTKVFGRQVEQATKLGASRIETLAAGDKTDTLNGYYTWARLGYDAPIPSDMNLPKSLSGANDISDLMKTPEGAKFWKENGSTIDMEFNLKPGSTSQRAFDKYLKKKGIKK